MEAQATAAQAKAEQAAEGTAAQATRAGAKAGVVTEAWSGAYEVGWAVLQFVSPRLQWRQLAAAYIVAPRQASDQSRGQLDDARERKKGPAAQPSQPHSKRLHPSTYGGSR